MPEKITASGWYVSIRCWVVAAALTSPMPPTVATAVTVGSQRAARHIEAGLAVVGDVVQ